MIRSISSFDNGHPPCCVVVFVFFFVLFLFFFCAQYCSFLRTRSNLSLCFRWSSICMCCLNQVIRSGVYVTCTDTDTDTVTRPTQCFPFLNTCVSLIFSARILFSLLGSSVQYNSFGYAARRMDVASSLLSLLHESDGMGAVFIWIRHEAVCIVECITKHFLGANVSV